MAVGRRETGSALAWILTLAAAGATLVNVHREFFPTAASVSAPLDSVPNWSQYVAAGLQDGPDDAVVRVIIFSDYMCPACGEAALGLDRLREELPDRLAVTWRNVSLASISSLSDSAAAAAICAADQGRFVQMHRNLFNVPPGSSVGDWMQRAREVGIARPATFGKCMGDSVTARRLREDRAGARTLGVAVTPTLLVNYAKYRGFPADLDRIVYAMLRRTGK